MTVSTDSMYWMSRLIAAITDAHFAKAVIFTERYQQAVFNKSYVILKEYDAKYLANPSEKVLEEANEKIVKMVKEESEKTLESVMNIASNSMKTRYNLPTDIGTDAPTITAFVYILVGMIAFVFAILTNSSIEKEAVIIGTLRASGYTKGEIVWHYLQPTLIIAILGSISGNLLGYTAMVGAFSSFYYKSYSVGPIPILFNVPMFLLTTILPVVLMIGINTLMLFRKLRLTPLKFLRNELKSGKDRKARKLPNISFMKRFGLRVIGQNRGSYITLFTGIFLSSFLLLFGIGIRPLMDHYTVDVNNSLNYNYQYVLKAPTDVDGGEKLFVQEFKSYFDLGKKDIGVSCYGIKEDSTFFKDAYVKDGISISSSLANKMDLDVNDALKVKDSMTDKEYTFTINKVYDYKLLMHVSEQSLIGVRKMALHY